MSRDDFDSLTLAEFHYAYLGWMERQRLAELQDLRIARWLACIVISPHVKTPPSPQKLLPLPGDNQTTNTQKTMTPEERKQKIETLSKYLPE